MLACVRALRRARARMSYGKSNVVSEHLVNRHMANWLIWRIDGGKSAYGETTSYRKNIPNDFSRKLCSLVLMLIRLGGPRVELRVTY